MGDIIVIIVTVLFSAFFSGMEIAFVSANRLSLELDKKQGNLRAGILQIFTNDPGHYIATMLVGNNISLVVYGIAFARLLSPVIESYVNSDSLILLIQTIISTAIILVTAEFLPKTLFRINPRSILRFFAVPLFIFYIVLWPISTFTIRLSRILINTFSRNKIANDTAPTEFTKIDLNHFISQNENIGEKNAEVIENEVKLFKNALDFSNVKIRDCMVPRTEIEAVEHETDLKEVSQRFIETGYSKILIFKENIDNIIGYIHSSQLFNNPGSLKSIINPIIIVPESMPANKLLSLFIRKHRSLALVVDEFGGTSGLVSSEDVLEEIFGEIEDEHDTHDLIQKQIKENEWMLSGRSEIDLINENLGLNLPESEDYETIAGLILHHHESIPKINTIVNFEQFEFRILKVSNTKIELVLLKINQ